MSELITYSKKGLTSHSLISIIAAGVVLVLASVGGIARFISTSEWLLLCQCLVAILFTVSLAYFCGSLSGNKRMFEALYPAVWYVGPMQKVLYVDFFGVDSLASWQAGMPYYFCGLSFALLMVALRTKNTH